jgi:hypothetical protein
LRLSQIFKESVMTNHLFTPFTLTEADRAVLRELKVSEEEFGRLPSQHRDILLGRPSSNGGEVAGNGPEPERAKPLPAGNGGIEPAAAPAAHEGAGNGGSLPPPEPPAGPGDEPLEPEGARVWNDVENRRHFSNRRHPYGLRWNG